MEAKVSSATKDKGSFEDFEPLCKWIKEEGHDTLEVHLPGFKREQIRVKINHLGFITISGEHPLPLDGTKWRRFNKQVKIRKNCNANAIHARFSDRILYVVMPKKNPLIYQQDQEIEVSKPEPEPEFNPKKVAAYNKVELNSKGIMPETRSRKAVKVMVAFAMVMALGGRATAKRTVPTPIALKHLSKSDVLSTIPDPETIFCRTEISVPQASEIYLSGPELDGRSGLHEASAQKLLPGLLEVTSTVGATDSVIVDGMTQKSDEGSVEVFQGAKSFSSETGTLKDNCSSKGEKFFSSVTEKPVFVTKISLERTSVAGGHEGLKEVMDSCSRSPSKREGDVDVGGLSRTMEVLEQQKQKSTAIFISGLDRNATEEEIRKAFQEVGEYHVILKLERDNHIGNSKVITFVFDWICGRHCVMKAVKGNTTLFLGNIDNKWNDEDIIKLVQGIGIKNINKISVMTDPGYLGQNCGFAFLEFATRKDAQNAYKIFQDKDVFKKLQTVEVFCAELCDQSKVNVKASLSEPITESLHNEKVMNPISSKVSKEKKVLQYMAPRKVLSGDDLKATSQRNAEKLAAQKNMEEANRAAANETQDKMALLKIEAGASSQLAPKQKRQRVEPFMIEERNQVTDLTVGDRPRLLPLPRIPSDQWLGCQADTHFEDIPAIGYMIARGSTLPLDQQDMMESPDNAAFFTGLTNVVKGTQWISNIYDWFQENIRLKEAAEGAKIKSKEAALEAEQRLGNMERLVLEKEKKLDVFEKKLHTAYQNLSMAKERVALLESEVEQLRAQLTASHAEQEEKIRAAFP
ncbi:inactive protein RESTRICTED TEV MOVEMENT 2-like [Quillaja saponaria]|uniref:Inactive protein RESTRICTED TEV MOVEMENT 2-like n=1 Tax=Quillaja saponaria TaxID=32244 RepID=A0AAD7Q8I6_QUISA|nr:inactive protein RESTRICTED TEV MOVEMENT 2-like [Quillaja saponaria]